MEFEWDPAKAASNLRKHGIAFEEAVAVFDDRFCLSVMVRLKRETLPPVTDARLAELVALGDRPDSEVDFSDIPELIDQHFAQAERGRFYRPVKSQVTARLDSDVLAWLKSPGRGYQSRMNAILRREMLSAITAKKV